MRYLGLALGSALALTGCNAILGIDDLSLRDGGTITDGTEGGQHCYGSFVRACFPVSPTMPVVLMDTIDTGTDTRCSVVTQNGGPEVCAIAGTVITMGGDTLVTGPRPLMLISLGQIAVSKKLDASSNSAANRVGPGANSSLCDPAVNGNVGNLGGGSGGAGGSFLTIGGGGGAGNGAGAGAATTANPPQQTMILRGGCAGGQGGSNVVGGGLGGAGGNGGGAIYLVGQSIAITDKLRASGGGGHHSLPNNSGGGAGGSGGMVVLEAPVISVMATGGEIVAHGAGGGEGARDTAGSDGREDRDWMSAPSGGSGQNDSGNGGTGAYGTTAATNGTPGGGGGGGNAGGGGGGGGHGAVRFRGQLGGTQISPPPVNF